MAGAANAVEIYEGQDFYVPQFTLKVRGQKQGQGVIHDVLQVSYRDNIEEIDNFEITINNWDADERDFKYSNSNLFNPGQEVELSMGYFGSDPLRLMIRGQITSLRPTFPAGGQPTLVISGLNLLHRLRTKQETHIYEKLTDRQIAERIGQRLKIKVDAKPPADGNEIKYDYLIQDNEYDIVFLMKRARRIGYDLFVQ